jgi:hypothetical protein
MGKKKEAGHQQESLITDLPDAPSEIESAQRSSITAYLRIDKTIRIAASGDVFVTRLEREIIDTPDFQRLHGVRQLGTALHVYPTALHTRFDHSLGTLAMADRMVKAIKSCCAPLKIWTGIIGQEG